MRGVTCLGFPRRDNSLGRQLRWLPRHSVAGPHLHITAQQDLELADLLDETLVVLMSDVWAARRR
jgi:hypothetical protein